MINRVGISQNGKKYLKLNDFKMFTNMHEIVCGEPELTEDGTCVQCGSILNMDRGFYIPLNLIGKVV